MRKVTNNTRNSSEIVSQFLQAIILSDLGNAESFLSVNERLAFVYTDVTDLSGRLFGQINALQYVFWALDGAMWTLLLKYINTDEAIEQIHLLITNRQDIIREHGEHVRFDSVTDRYKEYLDQYKLWRYKERFHYWQEWIGDSQKQLPAWWVRLFLERGQHTAWDDCLSRLPAGERQAPARVPNRCIMNFYNFISYKKIGWLRGNSHQAFYCKIPPLRKPQPDHTLTPVKTDLELMLFLENEQQFLFVNVKNSLFDSAQHLGNGLSNTISITQFSLFKQNKVMMHTGDEVDQKSMLLSEKIEPNIIHKFLASVAYGELDKVKKFLDEEKELVHVQGNITDLGGHHFKRITALQYAVWALDVQMWELLLTYFENEQDAAKQLKAFNNYRLDILTTHGSHFNFDRFLLNYTEYVKDYDNLSYDNFNDEKRLMKWRVVGLEQAKLPAWWVYLFLNRDKDNPWSKLEEDAYRSERESIYQQGCMGISVVSFYAKINRYSIFGIVLGGVGENVADTEENDGPPWVWGRGESKFSIPLGWGGESDDDHEGHDIRKTRLLSKVSQLKRSELIKNLYKILELNQLPTSQSPSTP